MMSEVLVLGANGYLGRQLCNVLAKSSEVYALTRTPQDIDGAVNIQLGSVAKLDLASVFNCVALYEKADTTSQDLANANYLYPMQVFDLISDKKLHFFNCNTSLERSTNRYAFFKHQFADYVRANTGNVKFHDLLLEQFFGVNDGRFISWLFSQFSSDVQEIKLTPGQQVRDFMYIEDLLSALEILHLEREHATDTIPVGSGTGHKLQEIIESAKSLFPSCTTKLSWGAVDYRANEAMNSVADTQALKNLGWAPQWNLEKALAHIKDHL